MKDTLKEPLVIDEDIRKKWQKFTNLLVSLFDVPSALIMQINKNKLHVFVKSQNKENPYILGNEEGLQNPNLFCRQVILSKKSLYVKNALKDKKWKESPDTNLNMINYLGHPIFDRNGEVFGTICVLSSEEREYSQAQLSLLEEFSNTLEDDLHCKYKQDRLLELEKMASLGKRVAGITHEINTPLGISVTGISHFLELNQNLHDKFVKEEMSEEDFVCFMNTTEELGKLIFSNLKKANVLLKSFKQISLDQSNEEKRVFNLKKYLEEIVLSLSSEIKKKKIEVEINCESKLHMYANAGLFSQIITNLIINSIKHGFKNKKDGKITINCTKEEDKVLLSYFDNGAGIKKENLGRIFDTFFSTNKKEGGSGLGLSITKNIILKDFAGSISCTSSENEKTEFKIELNETA
ncbi:MAG: hypothetical protein COA66_04240 [Arcobacter sp.]|nr:MAG: hypothetical protein COA66_04240 [Arcobacter sp.]